MDDIYEIRRKNLQRLLDSPALARLNRELDRADALDVSASMFSQIKNAGYKIGDPMARKIEEKQGLEYGWMDNPQSAPQAFTGSQLARFDPDKVVIVSQALLTLLRRREPDPRKQAAMVIDLGDKEDAELFCQAYAMFAPLTGGPEAQMLLGAEVMELLARREAENGRRTGGSEPAGGADGAQAGEGVRSTTAAVDGGKAAAKAGKSGVRRSH